MTPAASGAGRSGYAKRHGHDGNAVIRGGLRGNMTRASVRLLLAARRRARGLRPNTSVASRPEIFKEGGGNVAKSAASRHQRAAAAPYLIRPPEGNATADAAPGGCFPRHGSGIIHPTSASLTNRMIRGWGAPIPSADYKTVRSFLGLGIRPALSTSAKTGNHGQRRKILSWASSQWGHAQERRPTMLSAIWSASPSRSGATLADGRYREFPKEGSVTSDRIPRPQVSEGDVRADKDAGTTFGGRARRTPCSQR